MKGHRVATLFGAYRDARHFINLCTLIAKKNSTALRLGCIVLLSMLQTLDAYAVKNIKLKFQFDHLLMHY
jgi:hypothetical protein